MVCAGNAGFQSSWERWMLEGQDVDEMAGNQTTAGAVSIAWFVLKQPDELVRNGGLFFPCFGN